MADGQTYDFLGLDVRDLSELMADLLVAENLGFLNLFSEGMSPINVKHEWSQDDITAQQGALTAAALIGDTNFVVADSSVFQVNDIITAVTPAGVSSLERQRVTVIVDPTNITVVRAVGAAAAAIPISSSLKIVSRPQVENNKTFATSTTQPTTDFNYTEIFEASVEISNTQQTVKSYAMGSNTIAYQEMLRMKEIMVLLNRALIWGVPFAGTKSPVNPRRMGGLLNYATKTNLGAALDSTTIVNDAAERILRQGGRADALVCNTDIARKISAFNTGTSNLRTQLADRDAGSFVSRFVGDTPVSGIQMLVVDIDFPRDMLAVVDSSRLETNTLRPFVSLSGKKSDADDGITRVIRGECTSTWKNAAKVHEVIYNITL